MKLKHLLILPALLLTGCEETTINRYIVSVCNAFEICEVEVHDIGVNSTIIGKMDYVTYSNYNVYCAKNNTSKGVHFEYMIESQDDGDLQICLFGIMFSDYIEGTRTIFQYYNDDQSTITMHNITIKQLAEKVLTISLDTLWNTQRNEVE